MGLVFSKGQQIIIFYLKFSISIKKNMSFVNCWAHSYPDIRNATIFTFVLVVTYTFYKVLIAPTKFYLTTFCLGIYPRRSALVSWYRLQPPL